jgi:tryptophan halogenase
MKINKIVIIGGGTAGWWAAGYLEKTFPELDITLVESDTIPKIGVGESTLPQIQSFFESMGIPESAWMDKCNAIYKHGNIKQGWTAIDDEPFPFTFWFNDNNVFDGWLEQYQSGNKTKTQINDDLYNRDGWRAYAYHLDAELAGAVVKDHCKNVKHIVATLDDENIPDADLYLDCTGFRRQIVKDKTEIVLEHHLVDSAVVCPFELPEEGLPSFTQSIARPAGWQFIIGLQHRMGTGYVYSSKHITDEQAVEQFIEFNKTRTPFMDKKPRIIKWRPNVLKNPWSGNTIAIGMAGGFIDPLESNALFMTQFQITTLARCIQRSSSPEAYNRMVVKIWKENSNYIQHHYMLTERDDTDFWKYYKSFDVKKSLWENYKTKGNKYTEIYPDAIWASLGLYFEEFTHYEPK